MFTKPPKTAAGRRVVVLSDTAVAAFQSQLTKAEAQGMSPDEVPVIFPTLEGGWIRGTTFDRCTWHRIRKAAGVTKNVSFHDLRHTHVCLLIGAGVDILTISKRLGHSKPSTTLNLYGHLLPDAQARRCRTC